MAANNSMFGPFSRLAPLIQEDLKRLKDSSIYFLILGAALAALGVCAIVYAALFTIASMEVLGFLLVVGGAMFVGGSFFTGNWGGFFLTLLMGVLQLNVGLMCIRPDSSWDLWA
jgi:uncharacterized membrane protein HdeD (DUF308 family)